MPFFSIIIKKILKWIMTNITTLKKTNNDNVVFPLFKKNIHTSSSPSSPFPIAGHEIIPDDDKIFSPCKNN